MSEKTITASIQIFDHGRMIWRSDTGYIWALVDGGAAHGFPEPVYGHWRDNPIIAKPPPARVHPIAGFGKVWSNRQEIHSTLGWATEAEEAITLTVRVEDRTIYLTLPDQSLLRINDDSTWHTARIVSPPPVDAGLYITVAQHYLAMETLRADLIAYVDEKMADHIERSLTIDEIGIEMSERMKRPLTSAQLFKTKEA